jgi:precorrin-6B methylase 2
MDMMMREFRRYVSDATRTERFAAAIEASVRPGDVVVDLGAGFGLLSLLAARAGAQRVYAIEQGPYVELGRAIARDNLLADRIVWIHDNSRNVVLPELADVLVSETIGRLGLEDLTVEYLHDARGRLLRPGGRIVPQRLSLQITPVELPGARARLARDYGGGGFGGWSDGWENVAGLDLRRLRQAVLADEVLPYFVHAFGQGDRTLGPTVDVEAFTLGESTTSSFLRTVTCEVEHAGTLDGLLGTFDVELCDGVSLSTRPGSSATHWQAVAFPVIPPREVGPGERVELELGFAAGGRWSYGLRA